MKIAQRRAPDGGNVSATEESSKEEEEDECEAKKVLEILAKASGRPKVEIPLYVWNINVKYVMDYIS